MTNIFITGMSRSGTTFLANVINSINDTLILNQAFPYFFRFAKENFFKTINYPETYYVLNDYFNEERFSINNLTAFIDEFYLQKKDVISLFDKMSNFSGQISKPNYHLFMQKYFKMDFVSAIEFFLENTPNKRTYNGYKEILCEEFIPNFAKNGWKTIQIIRNPFDVISSIQYGKGEKYIGQKRPLLFHLRNWRKSADMGIAFSGIENHLLIKYEDLILKFDETLVKIIKFIFQDNDKSIQEIKSKLNKIQANSSFEESSVGINKNTINRYKKIMQYDMVQYITELCQAELNFYNYKYESKNDFDLSNYSEPFKIESEHFEQSFSTNIDNLKQEKERLNYLKSKNILTDKKIIQKYFIQQNVYSELRKSL